jgi:hemolysin III
MASCLMAYVLWLPDPIRKAVMTIFKLKQLASNSVHAAGAAARWNYDRAELIADGVVHGIGVFCGVVAATVLVVLTAVYATPFEVAVVSVYVAGLLAMLVLSATYNLWPVSRAKWVLRRFDHSAIYLLIAATYTPLIMELKDSTFAMALLIGVWCIAILGIVLKLARPGRYDRTAVGLYLALGWSGVMLYDQVVKALPALALGFVVAGGVLYSLGVIFHAWQRLRFQNAIWHGFVLLGAACHYTAILDLVLT